MLAGMTNHLNALLASTPALYQYFITKRVVIGTPKPEHGFPQLTIDSWFTVTDDNKSGYGNTQQYYLKLWHPSTQDGLLKGDQMSEMLAGLLHHTFTDTGIFITVRGREPLGDVQGNATSTSIQLILAR